MKIMVSAELLMLNFIVHSFICLFKLNFFLYITSIKFPYKQGIHNLIIRIKSILSHTLKCTKNTTVSVYDVMKSNILY